MDKESWYSKTYNIPHGKTYRFFLFIENKEFTKIVSLTGNDLETSGFLHSAIFCTNQKNAFQYTVVLIETVMFHLLLLIP